MAIAQTALDVASSFHGASCKTVAASSNADDEGSSGSIIISGGSDSDVTDSVSPRTLLLIACSGTREISSSRSVLTRTVSSSLQLCPWSTISASDGTSFAFGARRKT
eukprot:CAMPEP_0178731106 /NCGR_PEP_ID=MMETSP0699-20121125/29868_1 /TAXON_ID=265572 /ORGANISM="Extubocellulus spinifer, Strain CCMP396" /LENGTH=106 /DNA_ID=CAMNT_0020383161 /DNA_START=1104 /DNA_END=1424 /DNA_ORIENTATION=-